MEPKYLSRLSLKDHERDYFEGVISEQKVCFHCFQMNKNNFPVNKRDGLVIVSYFVLFSRFSAGCEAISFRNMCSFAVNLEWKWKGCEPRAGRYV